MISTDLLRHYSSLLDTQLLEEISQHAIPVSLRAGDTICQLGQDCSHLALVLSGSARVYQLAESGREITLYRVISGECCILTASCLLSKRTFPAIAVYDEALEAFLIPAGQVHKWMRDFNSWNEFIWTLVADRLSSVLCLLEEVTFHRLDQRLIQYLVNQQQQHGASLPLTHQTIADDLGTSREVISRILKDLQQQKLLTQKRALIEINNFEALKELLSLCD